MLDAVIQTSEYTIYKINRMRSLISKTEGIIPKSMLVKKDVSKLFEQPYIRPKNLLSDKIKSINTHYRCRISIATLAYVEWYKFDRNFAICQKIKNFDRRVNAPGLRLLCGVLYALP